MKTLYLVFPRSFAIPTRVDVIYEQGERVFHWDIQTRENNGEFTSPRRECFCPLFSNGFSNESRGNRMFWFADLNRISNQAYRNYRIRYVVDDKHYN